LKKLIETAERIPDVTIDPDEDIVAVLTGHQLKDPDYTVNYHLNNLYEEATYNTVLVRKSGKLESTFSNQPMKIAADKDEILRILDL
jgi:threonine synthase